MMRYIIIYSIIICLGTYITLGCSSVTGSSNQGPDQLSAEKGSSTVVPGHQTDDGSIPEGVVNGKYTSVYAYDANGDYYWDLGDGRVQGTVDSVEELDQGTLTVCDYVVTYRGSFQGDPFMDTGWIRNNIKCSGSDYKGTKTFNSLYVHNTDPRWSEDLEPIWGSWGILVDTEGGTGNIANPQHPVNN